MSGRGFCGVVSGKGVADFMGFFGGFGVKIKRGRWGCFQWGSGEGMGLVFLMKRFAGEGWKEKRGSFGGCCWGRDGGRSRWGFLVVRRRADGGEENMVAWQWLTEVTRYR